VQPHIPANTLPANASSTRRRGTKRLVAGIVVTLLGLMLAVASMVGVARSQVFAWLTAGSHLTPGTFVLDLDTGRHDIQARTAFGDLGRNIDVSVTGPSGDLVLGPASSGRSIVRGESQFLGIAQFDVTQGGKHEITVSQDTPGEVMVLRTGFNGLHVLVAWIIGIAIAAPLALLGLVLIIVGGVARFRSNKQQSINQIPPGFPLPASPVGPLS
jgi:hypothetical protein